jgi:hypothetical protein
MAFFILGTLNHTIFCYLRKERNDGFIFFKNILRDVCKWNPDLRGSSGTLKLGATCQKKSPTGKIRDEIVK